MRHVHAAHYAIAAILADGSVVTWGDPSFGGDSSAVQHQLRNVIQVCASHFAFAAILADGSIHMWGDTEGVCDTEVRQLRVQQIQTTSHAFAAILEDGSVVAWGSRAHGGDSSLVRDQLKNVQQLQATHFSFAAILADGSVVVWGHPDYGGDSSLVKHELQKCAACSGHTYSVRSDPYRWISGDMGRSSHRW